MMRCLVPTEYLCSLGYVVTSGCVYDTTPDKADVTILHRVRRDAVVDAVLNFARANGRIILYDTDDDIFGDAIGSSSELFKRRAAMRACDGILVATEYLAEQAGLLGPEVRVVRNGLPQSFLNAAEMVDRRNRENAGRETVRIAYYSGSNHHDADLDLVVAPLVEVLSRNPKVHFNLFGKIALSEALSILADRVSYHPFVSYDRFPEIFESIDINLAPLRLEDPVALGRSELKYVESAACGVPTLASPSRAYQHVIRSGVNGVLVEDEGWEDALQDLIDRPLYRRELGSRARTHVLENYGPADRSRAWVEALVYFLERKSPENAQNRRGSAETGITRIRYLQARQAIFRRLRRAVRRIRAD